MSAYECSHCHNTASINALYQHPPLPPIVIRPHLLSLFENSPKKIYYFVNILHSQRTLFCLLIFFFLHNLASCVRFSSTKNFSLSTRGIFFLLQYIFFSPTAKTPIKFYLILIYWRIYFKSPLKIMFGSTNYV